MDKYKNIDISEYIPLILVLSFVILHNIYLVITGIILSLFIINKEKINTHIKSNKGEIKKNNEERKDKKELVKENSVVSLVDKIEELGFIPSIDNEDDNYAA